MLRTHVVRPGDCAASIAELYGFADWQTIVDALQDGVGVLDTDGRILACNRAAAAILGRSMSELVGQSPRELAIVLDGPLLVRAAGAGIDHDEAVTGLDAGAAIATRPGRSRPAG